MNEWTDDDRGSLNSGYSGAKDKTKMKLKRDLGASTLLSQSNSHFIREWQAMLKPTSQLVQEIAVSATTDTDSVCDLPDGPSPSHPEILRCGTSTI